MYMRSVRRLSGGVLSWRGQSLRLLAEGRIVADAPAELLNDRLLRAAGIGALGEHGEGGAAEGDAQHARLGAQLDGLANVAARRRLGRVPMVGV